MVDNASDPAEELVTFEDQRLNDINVKFAKRSNVENPDRSQLLFVVIASVDNSLNVETSRVHILRTDAKKHSSTLSRPSCFYVIFALEPFCSNIVL